MFHGNQKDLVASAEIPGRISWRQTHLLVILQLKPKPLQAKRARFLRRDPPQASQIKLHHSL